MAITEYKVIKAHLDSIEQAMASAIGAGFQPVGQPVMQFPAEKTVLQVVAKGASSAITDYRIIKAPVESISAAMAEAIADGYQPFERPIMLYPADKTMLQAVIKGSADGGGEQVTIVVADITDATDIGKDLMTAENAGAARTAIGAGTSDLALGAGANQAAPGNHTHGIEGVTGLQDALDGKASTEALASKADASALEGKADASHTHAIANVTGLQSALDGKASASDLASKADASALAGKADTDHTHGIADVTGLQSALDGKAAAADLASLVGRVEALEGAAQ